MRAGSIAGQSIREPELLSQLIFHVSWRFFILSIFAYDFGLFLAGRPTLRPAKASGEAIAVRLQATPLSLQFVVFFLSSGGLLDQFRFDGDFDFISNHHFPYSVKAWKASPKSLRLILVEASTSHAHVAVGVFHGGSGAFHFKGNLPW